MIKISDARFTSYSHIRSLPQKVDIQWNHKTRREQNLVGDQILEFVKAK